MIPLLRLKQDSDGIVWLVVNPTDAAQSMHNLGRRDNTTIIGRSLLAAIEQQPSSSVSEPDKL